MKTEVANQKPKLKFPTETIDLPSKGFLYPEGNPLSSGTVEMKYMTAREEDILSNQNFIKKGIVLDKLLQSLIVSDIDYNDLLIGDKNALLIASRILGYGKDYSFKSDGEEYTVDLTELEHKYVDFDKIVKGKNEFFYTLPNSKTEISFRYLTQGDEKKIDREIAGLKKVNNSVSYDLTTRLKYIILSVDGSYETKDVRDFVDNFLLASDSRALRTEIKHNQPDVDMTFFSPEGDEPIDVTIDLSFFWPDY